MFDKTVSIKIKEEGSENQSNTRSLC